jgi:crotonobetainyl-CoA:carnitine CoA-transferase CaiB-like acyl-CoA transferase
MKARVGIADVLTGIYAAVGILTAVQARHQTGLGQHIDIALMNTQVAMLINQGVGYLTDGQVPPRRGNGHPTTVPCGTFPASGGSFIVADGTDAQFARFVTLAGTPGLAADHRFATNACSVWNRAFLVPLRSALTSGRPASGWLALCAAETIPARPVDDPAKVFASPQVAARGMRGADESCRCSQRRGRSDGNPLNLSQTPVSYAMAPPTLGEDTMAVLARVLELDANALQDLATSGVIEGKSDT